MTTTRRSNDETQSQEERCKAIMGGSVLKHRVNCIAGFFVVSYMSKVGGNIVIRGRLMVLFLYELSIPIQPDMGRLVGSYVRWECFSSRI